ncbi:MAG: GntR family transcriptional regulator [Gaiellaceae bacterium]
MAPRDGRSRAFKTDEDRTLVQLVTRELREAILGGRLKPGERIRQAAVADRYGVSRVPVREALRELQTDGLVTVIPNVGARVVRLDAAELDEVYWLRERFEPAAIAESAPRLDDAQLAEIRSRVDELTAHAAADEPFEWLAADFRLHAAALAACPLPRVMRMIESFWNLAEPYRRAFLKIAWGPELIEIQRYEHGLLLDALERREGDDAKRVLRMHIRRTRLSLQRHPEVFQH